MQLATEQGRSLLVSFQLRHQLQNPVQAFAGFLEEKREEIRIAQILVQFMRLTSTPRVPTISPSALVTATAMVKHWSPVNSDS